MTRVTKEMFSHLRISQQFFRADTEDSLVEMAEGDRAWSARNMRWIHVRGHRVLRA